MQDQRQARAARDSLIMAHVGIVVSARRYQNLERSTSNQFCVPGKVNGPVSPPRTGPDDTYPLTCHRVRHHPSHLLDLVIAQERILAVTGCKLKYCDAMIQGAPDQSSEARIVHIEVRGKRSRDRYYRSPQTLPEFARRQRGASGLRQ